MRLIICINCILPEANTETVEKIYQFIGKIHRGGNRIGQGEAQITMQMDKGLAYPKGSLEQRFSIRRVPTVGRNGQVLDPHCVQLLALQEACDLKEL